MPTEVETWSHFGLEMLTNGLSNMDNHYYPSLYLGHALYSIMGLLVTKNPYDIVATCLVAKSPTNSMMSFEPIRFNIEPKA